MTAKESKGWSLYQIQSWPLNSWAHHDGQTWRCVRCLDELKVVTQGDDGKAQEVGCSACKWAVNLQNQVRVW